MGCTGFAFGEMAAVVSVKKAALQARGCKDLISWLQASEHVYIGRNMSFYVPGAVQSKWANPFSVKAFGRAQCLDLYREWVTTGVNPITKKRRREGPLVDELEELQGKTLGCWCNPEPCHGDVLCELARANRCGKETIGENGSLLAAAPSRKKLHTEG